MAVFEKPDAELLHAKFPLQFHKGLDVKSTPMLTQLRLLRDSGGVLPALVNKAAHTVGTRLASKVFSEPELLVNKILTSIG